MTYINIVSNIVEENGKTVHQNNMEKEHAVPIGTLVEITYENEYEEEDERVKGLRLFVVDHQRDCDGTPLYGLSFSLGAKKDLDSIERSIEKGSYSSQAEYNLLVMLKWQAGGKIMNSYSEDCFVVVG